jgi:putative transcriptional regulator
MDPNFYKTVVYILSHDANGALGLVINRPSSTTIADVTSEEMSDSPFAEHTVYIGGPVDQNYLFALHTGLMDNYKSESSIEAVPGIVFEPDFSLLHRYFADRSTIDDRPVETDIRFFAGYAGWAGGQLEEELKRRDWVTLRANQELVFSEEPDRVWNNALFQKGGIHSVTAETGSRPSLN